MAKILVADDNSNVHKTAALALTDLGVEIVSVNNGEAAVRKLADFSPDLILADIFMPVRNGYEVCEYVKKDSRFSHVPVVLLVGAFDPLDEREAQRVGADGILKKPFVPPDPLITMVKTLLDRSMGERLVAVSASKPKISVQESAESNAIAEVHSPAPETFEESSSEEVPLPIERVAFGEDEPPVAFGQLLETSPRNVTAIERDAIELVDDEQILTSSRPATLGDPVFWRNDAPEGEGDAAEPQSVPANPVVHAWEKGEEPPPQPDNAVVLQPLEPLELVRDDQEEIHPSIVDTEPIVLDAAAQASLTVDSNKAGDLAVNPIEWMATAPAAHSSELADTAPGWDEPIPEAIDAIGNVEALNHPINLTPDSEQAPEKFSAAVSVPVLGEPDPAISDEVSGLAASLPIAPVVEVSGHPDPSAPKLDVAPSSTEQSATDTARSIPIQNWADLTGRVDSNAAESFTHETKSEIAPAMPHPLMETDNPQPLSAGTETDSSRDAALVEAVVQRVLDKMRPQVVDIITKEFLRPIVQALVHREIDKK